MYRKYFIGLLIWCVYLPLFAGVKIELDRTTTSLDEPVILTISSDDHLRIFPDTTPLTQDFSITGSDQHTQISVINGQTSMLTQWRLSLLPKHDGDITIPALNVGSEKTPIQILHVVKSKPTVTNTKSSQRGDIFMEVNVNPKEAFVNGQFIYNVKIFYDRNIENAYITPPELSDAKITQNGQDISYSSLKNGKGYRVLERSYIITPQSSGSFEISPPILKGYLSEHPTTDVFDMYGFSNDTLIPIRINGNTQHIVVKPKPSHFVGKWLPAKKINLTESWSPSPPVFRVGEPVSRIIEIEAVGSGGDLIPPITMSSNNDFNIYPEEPQRETQNNESNQIGKLKQTLTFIPTKTGKLIIPAIEVKWWNVVTQKERVTTIPAKTITVLPALIASGVAKSIPKPAAKIHSLSPNVHTKKPIEQAASVVHKSNLWPILTIIFVLLWLATIYLWRRQTRSPKEVISIVKPPIYKDVSKQLKQACIENDAAKARELFLVWATTHWKNQPIHSLSEVIHLLEMEGESVLINQIMELEEIFYGRDKHKWNGENFWLSFEKYAAKSASQSNSNNDPLPPLHLSTTT